MELSGDILELLLIAGVIVGVVVILAVVLLLSGKKRKQRSADLQQFALSRGFQFYGQEAPAMPDVFDGFRLAKRGRRQKKHNFFSGNYQGHMIACFDYYYITGSGKNTHHHWQTVFMVQSIKSHLPNFTLTPEGFGAKLGGLLGGQDIDFDHAPEFSKSFQLKGADEAAVRRLFTPPLLSYFASNPGVYVEGERNMMVFYRDNRRVKVADIPQFLDQGVQIANRLSSSW